MKIQMTGWGSIEFIFEVTPNKARWLTIWAHGGEIHRVHIGKYDKQEYVSASDLYQYFPNTSICNISCSIYPDDGDLSQTYEGADFTFTIPQNSATQPYVEIGGFSNDALKLNCYIANESTISLNVSAVTTKYGATFSWARLIVGNDSAYVSQNSRVTYKLPNIGMGKNVYVEVTDSRGFKYTTPAIATIDVYQYQPPKIEAIKDANGNTQLFIIKRAQKNDGTIEFGDALQGVYVGAKATCSPLDGNNKVTLMFRIRAGISGEWGDPIPLIEEQPTGTEYNDVVYDGTGAVFVNKESVYYVELAVKDKVNIEDKWFGAIPSEAVFMEKSGAKNTIAFGGHAIESNALEVHEGMSAIFYGGLRVMGGDGNLYEITVDAVNGTLKAEIAATQTYSLRKKQGG